MAALQVVLLGSYSVRYRDRLEANLTTPWRITNVVDDDPPERWDAALAAADAVVTYAYDARNGPAPRLRLLQVPAAGYELVDVARLPSGCMVANVYEHEDGIAEYVMAGILHFVVGLTRQDAELRRGDWRSSHIVHAPFRQELAGMSLGLVGIGHIGRAVAARARAFGMRVIGTARTHRAPPPGIDALVPLERLLPAADVVVIACPLDETTRGLIDAAAIARMRPAAIVINVGRGPVIDERALYEALADRRIGGAVIDVWYRYPSPGDPGPLPSDFPFETLDNVVMTPHSSGWTEPMMARRWRLIAANLDALARGEPLRNLVHRG